MGVSDFERFGSGLVPICEYGYFDNIVLNLAIFIALALIVSHYQKCLEHSKQTLVKGCLFVNLGYVAASLFMKKIFDGVVLLKREFILLLFA